jgi:uncharacterized membrane protein YhaH (DUF805 family)
MGVLDRISTGRLGRGRYFLWMALVLALFLGVSGWLGMTYGLRYVLGIWLPVSAILLLFRLDIAARRWRDAGFPGWPVSLGIAVMVALELAFLPPIVALLTILAVLLAELLLPPRSRA